MNISSHSIQILQSFIFYFRDNLLALAAFLISVISLAITWQKNIKDRRYANDKELLEHLKTSLGLAYNSLAIGESKDVPTNNRLSWITSARHIAKYWELRPLLRTKLYQTICGEHEEYWRSRFYNLMKQINDSAFFESINPVEMTEEQIDVRSAAIIYQFSIWKEDVPDPMNTVCYEEVARNMKKHPSYSRPLMKYIERVYPKLAEKVEMAPDNRIEK